MEINNKLIIGKSDKADFPEIKLNNINIKIDTGAYTSSIHCCDIKKIKLGRKTAIQATILDPSHPKFAEKPQLFTDFKLKKIKSSNGEVQERYIVKTTIKLFGIVYPIELSLSERGEMRFPVLIGRKLLNKRFIVDTSMTNVSYKLKAKRLKSSI